MTSQLLFGEPVRILEAVERYSRVAVEEDGTEGFVLTDQLAPAEPAAYRRQTEEAAFALELFCPVFSNDYGMPVTFGARLPDYDGIQLLHDGQRLRYSGQALLGPRKAPEPELMIRLARKWLYVPELPGGRTPTGVGGPELIQLLARLAGVRLPRDANAMSRQGRGVDFVEQCQEADLAFFDDDRGRLRHVGILLPDSQILHVSGRVRIDRLDHFGIFDLERRRYTHRLRVVRRVLPDVPRSAALTLDKRVTEAGDQNQQVLIF